MRYLLLPVALLCGIAGFVALGACNSGNKACPAKESITPGGSCNDEHQQCAYALTTLNAACDGTSTAIETSCTCTNGVWACPETFACDAAADAAPDGGEDADAAEPESDGSVPEDGSDAAPD